MMTQFLYRSQQSAPSEFLKGSRRFRKRLSILVSAQARPETVSNSGSAQQSVKVCILRGFLESDEFGLGGCQALRLQQQVIEIAVAATTTQEGFDVSIHRFHHPHG